MLSRRLLPVCLLAGCIAASASDWPQWRGPTRDGQAPDAALPASLPDSLKKGWSVEVGEGHSSPIVLGEGVYIHSRVGGDEVVRRLKLADGSIEWEQKYPVAYEPVSAAGPHGKGPKSTPVLHDGKLFTFGITGVLSAFNASDGKLLWRKDFKGDYGTPWPRFGAAMSPMVAKGRLLAHVGGDDDGALIAFNVEDGSVLWRWTEDGAAYCSPVLLTVAGTEQVVSQSTEHIIGVDLSSGKTLWTIPFTTPYNENSVTAIAFEDLLIFSGHRQRTFAVRMKNDGGKWSAEEVWTNSDVPMHMSSPVLAGGRVFGLTQMSKGNLFSLDPRSGKVQWSGPGRLGDNAALIVAGDHVLTLTTEAELIVTRIDAAKYEPVKTYDVSDSAVWAHPALIGNRLLVKDRTKLTVWSF